VTSVSVLRPRPVGLRHRIGRPSIMLRPRPRMDNCAIVPLRKRASIKGERAGKQHG